MQAFVKIPYVISSLEAKSPEACKHALSGDLPACGISPYFKKMKIFFCIVGLRELDT